MYRAVAYTISVERRRTSGTLWYQGSISVTATCWWDKDKRFPVGTYRGCSATTMGSKKNSQGKPREAIYFPYIKGYQGIFIHMGTGAEWSDGCIAINEPDMLKIYNDITPKNGANVTVIVKDIYWGL